jgi:hypothetical protein
MGSYYDSPKIIGGMHEPVGYELPTSTPISHHVKSPTWQLENVSINPNEIRASYKLNGLNHPKLRIDRTTGEITIKGTGQDFQGRCDKVDAGARRF